MSRLYHVTAALACLLLTAARHAPNYTHKPASLGAGVAAVSLAGPCVDYGYRSTQDSRGAILGLSGAGLVPGRAAYKQLRETAIYDCAPAGGGNLLAGELFNQHWDQASADPFIAVAYTVVQGPWRISLGGGFLYSHARPAVRWNVGPWVPFFGFEGVMKW